MTLLDAALAYQELMKYRYHFVLAHKGKAEMLTISFPEDAFHHLAGLHKRNLSRMKNKKHALQSILDRDYNEPIITDVEIIDRWDRICDLKAMIESNSLVFRIRRGDFAWSRIDANYVLSDDVHLFFVNDNNPVSVFTARPDKLRDVSRCMKLTTLKIEREEITTGISDTIFVSSSYRP